MRGPDGHDPAPAAPAAADPAPAADPAALSADPTALGGDPAPADPANPDGTALGGDPDPAPADPDPAPVVPETYELVAPEGMTIHADDLATATPVFKELGLTGEQANKLMPVAAAFAQRIQDQANQAIIGQVAADRKAWLDTAKNDPEIGGQHWDATLQTAASALDQLGFTKGTPFRNLLNESGLGNHPDMIRAFFKMGKAIGEDGFVSGNATHSAKRDTSEILYPNDQPKGGQ